MFIRNRPGTRLLYLIHHENISIHSQDFRELYLSLNTIILTRNVMVPRKKLAKAIITGKSYSGIKYYFKGIKLEK